MVNKRAVTTHYQLIRDAAAHIGGRVVETVSAGDCFFHAISIALSDIGVKRTVAEVRQLIGIKLQFQAEEYREMFVLEVGGERQQANLRVVHQSNMARS